MAEHDEGHALLEGRGLTKRFGAVLANDSVDFRLYPGEVHALLGENGAGKTTLMNLFYGLHQPDGGAILLRGEAVQLNHPADAIRCGVGMVHQHLMLIPDMTVAENIVLGREIRQGVTFLDMATANRAVKELSTRYGLDLDPSVPVGKLPIGLQQRVEIVKVLYRQADILILDEPTALLTPQETVALFQVIRNLAASGKSIIFITHKLKEVFEIADRITVLRRGRVVATTLPESLDERQLAELMIGREVAHDADRRARHIGSTLVDIEGLVVRGDAGRALLDHLTFQIRAGEILGVAGIEGNGQTELVEALMGLRSVAEGQILFDGMSLRRHDAMEARRKGIGLVPDDRQRSALVMSFKISENLVLNGYAQAPFASRLRLLWDNITGHSRALVKEFDIRTPSVLNRVDTLSGGNQQKVVVGRELSVPLRLLIAAQPTRGLDVASVHFIHSRLVQAAESGTAVLLISSDLDELLTLSDRLMVLLRGRSAGIIDGRTATKEVVGQMMLGVLEQPM